MEDFRAFLSELEEDIRSLLVKGDAYRWGTSEVTPDPMLAVEYYREAAEMGDEEAMGLLADLLEELGRDDEATPWRQRLESTSSDS